MQLHHNDAEMISMYDWLLCFLYLAKITDVVMATYRVLKNRLPGTLQSMSLYLANKDTEFILFKPVRVSISIRLCAFPNIVYECISETEWCNQVWV